MANNSDLEFGTPGYAEYLVPVRANGNMILARIIISAVSLALLTGLFLITSKMPQIFAVWLVVIAFFCWIGMTFTKREFEYTIASGEFLLDEIFGSRKRRKVLNVRISSAEKIAPVTLPDKAVTDLADKSHIIYACNKDDENMYYMLYKEKDTNHIVFFSAPDKTVKSLKFYNRAAVAERKKI